MKPLSLDIESLEEAYRAGKTVPEVIEEVYQRIAQRGKDPVWIHLVPQAAAIAAAHGLEARRKAGETLPLFGIPFAVKDNIHVAGLPTTAACPAFKHIPAKTATVVQRLLDAGAILIGKTNLDQFAAGLVGVRSPYGACSSVFDPALISGGSSAGSAVAVAAGLVSFSLGTDTAGSGRVPAAFNNIVGWKPTRGLLSTSGVVPACQSLDCVSIFSLTCADAQKVSSTAVALDKGDPYSRAIPAEPPGLPVSFRFGVPSASFLEFFGDAHNPALFQQAVERLKSLGGTLVEFDYAPFKRTADLLYSGPWVAERLEAIEEFFGAHEADLHPVTAKIIGGGRNYTAADTFRSLHTLELLRRAAAAEWEKMDLMLLPTAGTTYSIAQVEADPVQLNTNLGYYTNFVNLLDLSGVAVPAGFAESGRPFGVTLVGMAFADEALLQLGSRLHRSLGGSLGATAAAVATLGEGRVGPAGERVNLAVVGAHLTGQPLNKQLTERGAVLVSTTKTSKGYRLFALSGTTPPKPGLVRTPGFEGPGIEVEVWSLPKSALGSFMTLVSAPLGIGSLELSDGSAVKGFICEHFATETSRDITPFGGWRRYLGSVSAQ